MKDKALLLFANPEFDRRFNGGISKLYRIFSQEYGYNLEIVTLEFLKHYIPEKEYSKTLVIVGGDGTINRVINSIPDEAFKGYTFGIIPGGTANELAKALDIPLSITKAADLIINPKTITYQHLGFVNDEYKFVTGFLYGIACKVLEYTPVPIKHLVGPAAFDIGFVKVIFEYINPWGGFIRKFKINSKEFRTNYLLINNVTLGSKGLQVNEISEENRNLFSIVYIHSRLKLLDIIRIILKYRMRYQILQDKALHYEQLGHIKLEFEDILEFLLDGDLYSFESPVNIRFFKHPMALISG